MAMEEDHLVTKLILFTYSLIIFKCLLGPMSALQDSWDISRGINNKCMLPRIKLNRETLYVIPYKLTYNEFADIYQDSLVMDDFNSKEIHNNSPPNSESNCNNFSYFLIEQYEPDGKFESLENYNIKFNNQELIYKKYFGLNFYYYKGLDIFTEPIVYYSTSPKRVENIYFRELPSDIDATRLEKRNLQKGLFIFCEGENKINKILKIESKNYKLNNEEFRIPNNC